MSSHLVERGIALWKSGKRVEARKVFEAGIYNDRQNETAWIWYIYALETNREKIAALETFLSIFPQHASGKKALENLNAEELQYADLRTKVEAKPRKTEGVHQEKPLRIQAVRSVQRSTPNLIPWVLVIIGICFILTSSIINASRYNSLQSEYRNLKDTNQKIARNYDQLRQDFQVMESEKETLVNDFNYLVTNYNSLNTEYSILQTNYDSLYSEHTQMLEKYNALAGDYNTLNNIAIKPPYIVVHDREVDTTFYDIDGQLVSWVTPFAGLEYDIENGAYTRRLIVDDEWQTILVSRADNSSLWIRDFSVFVTPETFRNVIPELYRKSSSPHEFIYRIWYMIGQLSNYASEDIETPRYSLETLLAGGGDCEDLSILLASMIKAAPVDWYVDLVYVDSENINNPQDPDHVVVYIDTGQDTFIVESTSDQIMLPYTEGVTGWLAGNLRSNNNHQPVYLR